MADAMGAVQNVNAQIVNKASSAFTFQGVMYFLGWIAVAVLVIGSIGLGIWWYYNKRMFNKNVSDFELINGSYVPTTRDKAKTIKLGNGGFEVLFLQKAKKYRLSYGARVGKSNYYFFIGQDGYAYNGVLGGTLTKDGTVPIIITNPNARAQYTSLEDWVEHLYGQKKSFWDQYGNWILSGMFILIIGVFAWLMFKENAAASGNFVAMTNQMATLMDKVNNLIVTADRACSGAAGQTGAYLTTTGGRIA